MKFILGKKIEMTQIWKGDNVVAVTKVQAGPCVVTQIKIEEKDGYKAVQIGYGEKKEKNIKKPQKGHLKKLKINLRYLNEFRIDNIGDLKIGDAINVSTFEEGDKVKVTGTSKGKGFQGVVKRYNFHGQDKTHGTKDQLRMPGSAGATGPAHVFKGQRMPGRMGGDKNTIANLEIIEVDNDNNILFIKGAVPGARNGLVLIQGEGELKTISNEQLTINNKKEEKIEKPSDDKAVEDKPSSAEAMGDKKEEKTEEKKNQSKSARPVITK